jgi:hypothetical protein
MKKYEIWLGDYHLGQGYHHSGQAEKVGEEFAYSFEIACLQYELRSKLKFLENYQFPERLTMQDFYWNYDPKTKSNSWTGKYYESKEEALKSFK